MVDEVYEAYVRTAQGATMDLPFREALEQFLSDDGYRILINIEGVVLVLRKDTVVGDDRKFLDTELNERSINAMVTIRTSSSDPILKSMREDYSG